MNGNSVRSSTLRACGGPAASRGSSDCLVPGRRMTCSSSEAPREPARAGPPSDWSRPGWLDNRRRERDRYVRIVLTIAVGSRAIHPLIRDQLPHRTVTVRPNRLRGTVARSRRFPSPPGPARRPSEPPAESLDGGRFEFPSSAPAARSGCDPSQEGFQIVICIAGSLRQMWAHVLAPVSITISQVIEKNPGFRASTPHLERLPD